MSTDTGVTMGLFVSPPSEKKQMFLEEQTWSNMSQSGTLNRRSRGGSGEPIWYDRQGRDGLTTTGKASALKKTSLPQRAWRGPAVKQRKNTLHWKIVTEMLQNCISLTRQIEYEVAWKRQRSMFYDQRRHRRALPDTCFDIWQKIHLKTALLNIIIQPVHITVYC